jgi:hypothetical protein
MERRWLNPNQLKYRIRAARGIFDDLQAKQIMEILQQSGAADEVAPFFGGEAPAEKPADASIDELAEHAMRAGLQRADAAMVRIWEAQKARQDSVQAFNVQVDVTDYRIADPSLRRIVLRLMWSRSVRSSTRPLSGARSTAARRRSGCLYRTPGRCGWIGRRRG